MNPHRYPPPPTDFHLESVIAWRCVECGEWCYDAKPTPCPVRWHPQFQEATS